MKISISEDVKGLIFDCDGTLADTMGLHLESWEEALSPFGVSCGPAFFEEHAGFSSENIVHIINARFGAQLRQEEVVTNKERNFVKRIARVQPMKPVVDVAREYHEKLPMAVVSGGVRNNVEATLRHLELFHLFSVIITADDPVKPKPAPDIFIEASKRLGVPSDACLVFEDAEAGITGARAAGMKVIDVREIV